MSDTVTTASYATFVAKATQLGMPVRMLEEVRRKYTFNRGGDSASDVDKTSTTFSTITLTPRTVQTAVTLSFSVPGGSFAVKSIYHEATHAWLDLFEDDEDVKKIQKGAEAYYKDKILNDGSAVSKPTEVFTEAAATYVADRMSTWFRTMEMLTFALEGLVNPNIQINKDKRVKMLKDVKANYNKGMAVRMFGYQQVPDKGWTFKKHQEEVKAPIYPQLMQLCNSRLLENKLSDNFDSDQKLSGLWTLLAARYPEVN